MRAVVALLLLTIPVIAQEGPKYACSKADRELTQVYLQNKKEVEALADTLRQNRRGHLPICWHGCAVNLPKPTFPPNAKNAKISGSVTIHGIADETGRIFYARPTSGPEIFRSYARQAACSSSFNPILNGDKRMLFPWTIRYNFIN